MVGDYAVCVGTTGQDDSLVLSGGTTIAPNGAFRAFDGVRFAEITDGLSHTLMVGEKHVPLDGELNFPWDCGLYDGHNPICNTRSAGPSFPLASSWNDQGFKLGSRHFGVVHFAFCDGSVQRLADTISPIVLGLLSQRNDGQVIPNY